MIAQKQERKREKEKEIPISPSRVYCQWAKFLQVGLTSVLCFSSLNNGVIYFKKCKCISIHSKLNKWTILSDFMFCTRDFVILLISYKHINIE
jgi:hypothetical protein